MLKKKTYLMKIIVYTYLILGADLDNKVWRPNLFYINLIKKKNHKKVWRFK